MKGMGLSAQRGAALERAAWMAKVRRLMKAQLAGEQAAGYKAALEAMLEFGKTRVARYERRPGGLGRARQARKR